MNLPPIVFFLPRGPAWQNDGFVPCLRHQMTSSTFIGWKVSGRRRNHHVDDVITNAVPFNSLIAGLFGCARGADGSNAKVFQPRLIFKISRRTSEAYC
jgi:hypothetical protein